jgi:hypothetical protein
MIKNLVMDINTDTNILKVCQDNNYNTIWIFNHYFSID